MPRPPNFDAFTDLRFITNYYLVGCSPPLTLVVETSIEPTQRLTLLFIGFDPEEWFQELFAPGRGRRRTPSRKGRKRPRFRGLPDWNSYLAGKVRARLPGWNGINLPGFRTLFRLWGAVEAVNFTVAVVEGLTDIGFAHLWGVFKINPFHCTDFGRIARERRFEQALLYSPSSWGNIAGSDLIYNNGFVSPNGFGWRYPDGASSVTFEATIRGNRVQPSTGRLGLIGPSGTVYDRSGLVTLDLDETVDLQVSADIPADEFVAFAFGEGSGLVLCDRCAMIGFSQTNWPWQ